MNDILVDPKKTFLSFSHTLALCAAIFGGFFWFEGRMRDMIAESIETLTAAQIAPENARNSEARATISEHSRAIQGLDLRVTVLEERRRDLFRLQSQPKDNP